jgi:Trk K+ transport system NAD-binding subunit
MTLKSTLARGTAGPDVRDPAEHYVLGGGPVAELVARRLSDDGHTVAIVDESYAAADLRGHKGDPTDVETLKAAGLSAAATVFVATGEDHRNLLIAQLVRAHFDVASTVVLVNHPDRFESIAAAGHQTICASSALADALIGER